MQQSKKIILAMLIGSLGVVLLGFFFFSPIKKSEINVNNDIKQSAETPAQVTLENGDEKSDQESTSTALSQKTEASAEVAASPSSSVPESVVPPLTNSSSPTFKITDRLVNWGFAKSSGRTIDTIIIHSSYNAVGDDVHDLDDIINKEYKPSGVSPHYIIDRQGNVYRLLKDQYIAYHAGVSKMPDGRTNVNNFSLGIEMVETMKESPSTAQYASLKKLIAYLKGEYKIKYVLGHSDIAPERKTDPWNFSWSKIGGKEK